MDARLRARPTNGAAANPPSAGSASSPQAVEPAEEGAELAVAEDEPPGPEPVVEANGTEPENGAEDELPSVEALSRRVPPAVAAALDELFRTKWTGVRRLRSGDVKGG